LPPFGGGYKIKMMLKNTKADNRPIWVRAAVWGIRSRGAVQLFFWISILLAATSLAYAVVDRRFLGGLVFVLSAYWYFRAMRWLDKNDDW